MFENKPNILIVTPAKLYEFSTSQTEFSEFSEFSGTKKMSHSFTHFESHSPCKSQENCLVQSIVLGIIFRICKLFWLVVLTILKHMKVNGKDDIPYEMDKMSETTNHIKPH